MKILRLTLQELPFKTTEQLLKHIEYRIASKWLMSRLIDSKTGKPKHYDIVLFTHGYGNDKPFISFTFYGFEISKRNYKVSYKKTGLNVKVKKGMIRIKFGSLYKKGNITQKQLF